VDRFALIFIYYPLLQQSCRQFTRIWNHHKLRTERHQTPIQLYADGNPGSLWMPSSPQELQEYGIDWNGPVSMNSDDDDNGIAVVEPPTNPLHEQDYQVLKRQFQDQLYPHVKLIENNIMSPHFNYGVDMYIEVQEWIQMRLANYI